MAADGKTVPALENRPEVVGLEWIVEGFFELTTCRPASMGGVAPIPWSAIKDFIHEARYDEEHAFFFHQCIRAMDSALLDWNRKESKRKQEESKRKAGRGSPGRARMRNARR